MPEDGLIYPYEIRYYEGCFYLYVIDSMYLKVQGSVIGTLGNFSASIGKFK